MFSTPLIASASGAATVCATVSASAPGNWAVTATVGGTTLGYCSIGSTRMLTTPINVRMIARTVAKIGRLMKKLAKFIGRHLPCPDRQRYRSPQPLPAALLLRPVVRPAPPALLLQPRWQHHPQRAADRSPYPALCRPDHPQ